MNKKFYHPELLQTPEGVRDIYGKECMVKKHITDTIHSIILGYGFHDIETPLFEYFDIFNKERGTVKPNEMYKFFDRNNNTLVLRPDITPSIARCVAKYYEDEELPVRLCYVGNTFTCNTSYQGKLTEITQAGAELINDDTPEADAQMISLTVNSLYQTGLREFRIDVGDVDFFNGLVMQAGLNDYQKEELKSLLTRKNTFAVENFLSDIDMDDTIRNLLIKLPEMFGDEQYIAYAKEHINNPVSLAALNRLEEIGNILDASSISADYVNYDLGMVSGFAYYTGVIFKAYTYGTGEPIATGGRYDKLLSQFGKDGKAIGAAFNIDQIMIAMQRQKITPEINNNSAFILYEPDCFKKAYAEWNTRFTKGDCVQMTKKSPDVSVNEYEEYVKRYDIKEFIYIS